MGVGCGGEGMGTLVGSFLAEASDCIRSVWDGGDEAVLHTSSIT